MNDKRPLTFNTSKILITLLALFNIVLFTLVWGLNNQEVALFLIENPIVIIPYLLDKLGFVKFLLLLALVVGFVGFTIAFSFPEGQKKGNVVRGTKVMQSLELQERMKKSCRKENNTESINDKYTNIHIGNIPIPKSRENKGFFFFGDPGTGKSQSIKQILFTLKRRSDFRGIIFDRNGEMLKQFFEPGKDIIYNPFDARSVDWCHTYEAPVRPETMAEALIPPPLSTDSNPFFQTAAGVVVGEIFRITRTNEQVYSVLTKPDDEIKTLLEGTLASRYLTDTKLASSVVSTANNYCKFYRYVQKPQNNQISFYNWAYKDDPRWIFVTLKENDAPVLKPLHSMLFELMLKGLLSNQNRKLKTAIIIDELGALNRLDSLGRLLSESRKFLGCPFLGTQTQAQITKIYGKEETSILLQGTLTKLMLRCSDPETSETMAKLIGKHEKVRYKTNTSKTAPNFKSPGSQTRTTIQDYQETYAILPSEFQNLPDLMGYFKSGDLSSTVQIQYVPFKDKHESFASRDDV
jgi:hypothetical protein